MRFKDIRISEEAVHVLRFPLLLAGGRKIYYDDIEDVDLMPLDGRVKASLAIRLKEGELVRVDMSSEKAERLKAEIKEIVHPKLIMQGKPLSFEQIGDECMKLSESPGQNIRKVADFILSQGISHDASDIHMEYREDSLNVFFKVDGMMFKIAEFENVLGEKIINCIKVSAGMHHYYKDKIQEGRIIHPVNNGYQDLRVSVIPSPPHEKVAVRIFDKLKGLSKLEDIGFSGETIIELKHIAESPSGLFIICGPSSSGKTTTLYALIRYIKETRGYLSNIITAEDPIEYRLQGITQVQVDPKGELTFQKVLMSSLRQDPGIIMLGEIRDTETAEAAIQAALTGHLVLSTLHCGSAAEAVTRLLDLGVKPFLLRSTLRGMLCQRLIRKICADCKQTVKMSSDRWKFFTGQERVGIKSDQYVRGAGCPSCHDMGYKGRTVIAEFLISSDKIGNLIINKSDTAALENTAVSQGMITLRQMGAQMVSNAITDPEEIMRVIG